MPFFTGQNCLQLIILLLVVPTQYLLTYYFSSTLSQKTTNLQGLKSVFSSINDYLEFEYLKKLCSEIYEKFINFNLFENQNAKLEIPIARDKSADKYFASSQTPRNPRPSHVKYRVGQVIRHRNLGYSGVIIGWDPKTYAPEFWINSMYPVGKEFLLEQPSYSILVDYRNNYKLLRTYVNEVNVEILSGAKILNNEVNDYFESFDGSKYVARPRLKKIYPHD